MWTVRGAEGPVARLPHSLWTTRGLPGRRVVAFPSLRPLLVLAHSVDFGNPQVSTYVAFLGHFDDEAEGLLQLRQLEPPRQPTTTMPA